MEGIKTKPMRHTSSVVALAVLGWVVTLYCFLDDIGSYQDHQRMSSGTSRRQLEGSDADAVSWNEEAPSSPEQFDVCGRAAGFDSGSWSLQQKQAICPPFEQETPVLVLQGYSTYGQTGNQLRSLLNALQYARDNRMQLGIMYNSWAMGVILEFFMARGNTRDVDDEDWKSQVEKKLCVKIVHRPEELQGRRVILKSQKHMFGAKSSIPVEELMASQLQILRTLFQNYNTGEGSDQIGREVRDMCSGIDSLFGVGGEGVEESHDRRSAVYSVVHLRYFEGNGLKLMGRTAHHTGSDPVAALEMAPEYVKSILAPLGMLDHPIVVITDGQNGRALERLRNDPDVGPMIREVPKQALWFGGDVTLAVMGNVFIGNPSSTMSGFIAMSRVALGFGNNYLYRAKNEQGEWVTTCEFPCYGDVLFKQNIEPQIPPLYLRPPISSEKWRKAGKVGLSSNRNSPRISWKELVHRKQVTAMKQEAAADAVALEKIASGSGLHPNEVAVLSAQHGII